MKLKFLGTRGEINFRTELHSRHASLLVSYKGRKVVIDRGEDWLNESYDFKPAAILITHAHDDHAGGLKKGAPCKVYATKSAARKLRTYRQMDIVEIEEEKIFFIGEISFAAYTVEHSIIAPAVGFRIIAGNSKIFYSPDLIYIHKRSEALKNIDIYIGDGAAVSQSFIRKREKNLIGHSRVRDQISWCAKEKVPKVIITHCGSEIVRTGEEKIKKLFEDLGIKSGVDVQLAYDGMELLLNRKKLRREED